MSFSTSGSYSYTSLKILQYGPGSLSTLPDILKKIGVSKALVLTGKSISKSPVLPAVEKALGSTHATTFTDIGQHAPIAGIKAAFELLDSSGADAIVAVGGGSPIDAAKAISYYKFKQAGGEFIKVIAIPTTLSAAEFSINAGYTNDDGHKVAVSQLEIAPMVVLMDAELTIHTPERLWLSTGLRALDHAIETLYRTPSVPFPVLESSLSSIPLLFTSLLGSKADPSSIPIRQTLQNAAYLSFIPNPQPGALGLSHGLGHKLGATYSIPHGITSCLTLAGTVALVSRTTSDDFRQRLGEAMKRLEIAGVTKLLEPTTRFVKEGDDDNQGVKLAGYVDALVEKLGLAGKISDWKVPKDDINGIAVMVEEGKLCGGENQPKREQVLELLNQLY